VPRHPPQALSSLKNTNGLSQLKITEFNLARLLLLPVKAQDIRVFGLIGRIRIQKKYPKYNYDIVSNNYSIFKDR
jgi:hypothetical protein